MANHIDGPLYFESQGRAGPVMVFIHPNPMDQSAWLYQMAYFSTWFRCIAVDLPGYGRSPRSKPGLTLDDLATACWEVADAAANDEAIVIVGSSAGSQIAPQMFHQRPGSTLALILSGTGYLPDGDARLDQARLERLRDRIRQYRRDGVAFRWRYTFDDFSPAFRASAEARYFAELFASRNHLAHVPSIIRQLEALGTHRGDDYYSGIGCPTLVLTGTEDNGHPRALMIRDRIPRCELAIVPGAGHACQIEQPVVFNALMMAFLRKHRLVHRG